MRLLASRALSSGRQAILQQPVSFPHRSFSVSALQAAEATYKLHAGYRVNPANKPSNPNKKDKIPYKDRQLTRPITPPPTKTAQQLAASLPYIVRRTPYSQVPVYRKWMSGGNREIILIKKVEGDRSRLVEDLAVALDIKRPDIRLNPTTQHIEIKGNYFNKAIDWLLKTGF
ncbi:hypothetical protein NM208_g10927 [Fusarium decemcellulare]|uniref:Uncharacterized protein n=1 Tax=Fusarium decemcellulare TaxID=57161 RepID=A0ACC1RWD0_9HYPO|nr:hypothetical protein NM208_g10927 [Fusarium decemcellulare]